MSFFKHGTVADGGKWDLHFSKASSLPPSFSGMPLQSVLLVKNSLKLKLIKNGDFNNGRKISQCKFWVENCFESFHSSKA